MNRLGPKSFFFGGGVSGRREREKLQARRQECVRPKSLSRFDLKQQCAERSLYDIKAPRELQRADGSAQCSNYTVAFWGARFFNKGGGGVVRLRVPQNRTYNDLKRYNPKSEKVGTVWKTQIKKESSDF